MDKKRPDKSGSFAGGIGELIKHSAKERSQTPPSAAEERALQEKKDIHALLFEHAWRVEGAGKRRKD
jgi:hypothetical protein